MFVSDKILWKEGLFLQPQHLQQAERFLLNSMQARFSTYNQYYYGFSNLEISTDALLNNSFTITSAQGILPDGTIFSIPDTSAVPHPRNFKDLFPLKENTLEVYLALPMVIPGRASLAEQSAASSTARYTSSVQSVHDEVYGLQTKDIEVGKTNFTILFGNETRDNFTSMQIAQLTRTQNGQIGLDKTFVPPLLHLSASQVQNMMMRSLLEMLIGKSNNLSQGRKQLKGGFAEFTTSDSTPLALLQTINTYLPIINHYNYNLNTHPYELYLILLQFTGALCTFSSTVSVTALPQYDHGNLSKTFEQLNFIIREILRADISAGCVQIPINEISSATYLANITDQKLFEVANFYIGVQADIHEKELIIGSLTRIKMSSRNQLDKLIQSAMPGLPLMHAATPPKELSSKPGFAYFSLNQRNSFWDTIKSTGTIAVYFPNNYPNLKLELLAVTA